MSNSSGAHDAGHLPLQVATLQKIDRLLSAYPTAEAALIPALHAIQDDLGWISDDAIVWAADRLGLAKAHVLGVVSFYSMLRRSPSGRHRLEICTNLSCSLLGAEHLRDYLCKKLQIKPGETTADKMFTLSEVECLGSCGTAPVMLVDDEFHENLDPAKIDAILVKLRHQQDNRGGEQA